MAKPPAALDGIEVVKEYSAELAKERGFVIVSLDHVSSAGRKAYTRFYMRWSDARYLAKQIDAAAGQASQLVR